MPSLSMCLSIRPLSALISMLRAPKKSRRSSARPVARRVEHEAASCGRCCRKPFAPYPDRRTDRRHRLCRGIGRGPALLRPDCRQGLRLQRLGDSGRAHGGASGDSAPLQPTCAAPLRSSFVSNKKSHRALLQSPQAFSPRRHSLRPLATTSSLAAIWSLLNSLAHWGQPSVVECEQSLIHQRHYSWIPAGNNG